MTPTRFYPSRIRDLPMLHHVFVLLLERLAADPIRADLPALSYDAMIDLHVLQKLADRHEIFSGIHARDYHVAFANILFRYPTVRIWRLPDESFFIAA